MAAPWPHLVNVRQLLGRSGHSADPNPPLVRRRTHPKKPADAGVSCAEIHGGGIAHNERTCLKAAASVITVLTPSGGFRGRFRENGEKALIGSLPYRAGKATEDIASLRHHPLHGVRCRGNVVDKADSLSGQPGHLLPIAHLVRGRQNYVELAQHHVLAEEASTADLGQIVAPRRHLAQAVVPFSDDAIVYDAHRIEVRPFGTKDGGVNGL